MCVGVGVVCGLVCVLVCVWVCAWVWGGVGVCGWVWVCVGGCGCGRVCACVWVITIIRFIIRFSSFEVFTIFWSQSNLETFKSYSKGIKI